MDWAQLFAYLLTFVTLVAAIYQLKRNNEQMTIDNARKKSEYISSLYQTFMTNSDIRDIFYRLEYGQFKYDKAKFHQSKEEKQLDQLLGHLSVICRFYRCNILSRDDLYFFEYEIIHVYMNLDVQKYLNVLDDWCLEENLGKKYMEFREIGAELCTLSQNKD